MTNLVLDFTCTKAWSTSQVVLDFTCTKTKAFNSYCWIIRTGLHSKSCKSLLFFFNVFIHRNLKWDHSCWPGHQQPAISAPCSIQQCTEACRNKWGLGSVQCSLLVTSDGGGCTPWLPPWDRRIAPTHRELQERGHTGKELQDEGFAVQDVELAAGELDGLAQLRVALVVRVHLGKYTWKRTWSHHPTAIPDTLVRMEGDWATLLGNAFHGQNIPRKIFAFHAWTFLTFLIQWFWSYILRLITSLSFLEAL